ncbi:hypothetical protein BCR42DRAFT_456335 [Absidia repens]|uniref:GATA-type domain-containing protein n=1 Tax=Absidia repens TaxID=90262 RepID=A0A1X2I0D1_9FUNG|nr:hypothetical protein BCR42DRAFT_456335 [Absidia repens]
MIDIRTNGARMSSCFWALLSLPDYEFLYLPSSIMDTVVDHSSIKDLLLGKAFIDFIHPDERSLAMDDFNKFTDLNTLAGAVTRCRLRKLDCIAHYNKQDRGNELDWIVVDVIMYTAAENIILAFFHCDQGYPACPHTLCDHEEETEINGIHHLPGLFQHYHNQSKGGHVSNHQEQSIGTLRAFQLYNNVTQDIVMSWPAKQHLPSDCDDIVDAIQDDFQYAIQQQQQNKYASFSRLNVSTPCTHHTRSTSNLSLNRHGALRFEKILIRYGQFTFAVFQISPSLSSSISRFSSHSPSLSSVSSTSSTYSPTTSLSSPNTITNGHNKNSSNGSADHDHHHPLRNGSNQDHPFFQSPSRDQHHKRGSPSSSPLSSSSSKSWRIRPNEKKRCESCHTSHSPEWRRGPSGHRTLCNACGLRYSRSLVRQEQRATMSPTLSHASVHQQQQQHNSFVNDAASISQQQHYHQQEYRLKYPGQRRFFNLYP